MSFLFFSVIPAKAGIQKETTVRLFGKVNNLNKKFLAERGKTMDTLKRKVIAIAIGLTALGICTIAYGQRTKEKPEISKDQLIKQLQAQVEQLQAIIKTQEAEIQRLKELCKKAGIETKPKAKQEKVVMPTYSVLNEDVYDIPLKTQVELNILVSGEISESGLRALLNKLYTSTKAKKGFKYHSSPTNIYIYTFTSKERFESGMGQWIAMLQQSPGDLGPRISINKRQIAQLSAKPEEKFGLSEVTRKQIWSEIVKAEDRATKEAEQRYPLLSPSKPGYSQSAARKRIEEQIDFQRKLNNRYRNELAKKNGLTLEQLKKIALEGVTKDWPFPK